MNINEYNAIKAHDYNSRATVCMQCGTVGQTKTVTKGSFWMEVILWIFFLLPGLLYSTWRLTTRYKACRACGSNNLVPLNSPRGKAMIEGRAQ